MEQLFQPEKDEQTALTDAINKAEYFALAREYVVSQIMLRHKDKNLRFDQQSKVLIETIPDSQDTAQLIQQGVKGTVQGQNSGTKVFNIGDAQPEGLPEDALNQGIAGQSKPVDRGLDT